MKAYNIYYFDERTQTVCFDEGRKAYIKANNPIEALKKFYTYINTLAGGFKVFTYEAIEII